MNIKSKKMSDFFLSPYTYAVIIAIAAFLAAIGSQHISNTRNLIAKQTENLVDTASETLAQMKDISQGINFTLEKTLEAKDATISAQKDILGQITGGDSFSSYDLIQKQLRLRIQGDYSIPNLKIKIYFLKNYIKIPFQEINEYLKKDVQNSKSINMIFDGGYEKLFQNVWVKPFELPRDVLSSIYEDDFAGFDIYFTTDYKCWKQSIRLMKNLRHPDRIEYCSFVFEDKNVRSDKITEKSIRRITEASPDFFSYIKETPKLFPSDTYPVILYPNHKLDIHIREYNIKDKSHFELREFK